MLQGGGMVAGIRTWRMPFIGTLDPNLQCEKNEFINLQQW